MQNNKEKKKEYTPPTMELIELMGQENPLLVGSNDQYNMGVIIVDD